MLWELFVDECLQLFQVAPQLTYCDLQRIINGSANHPIPQRPTVVSSLKRLSIAIYDIPPFLLFGRIQTPALEYVDYSSNTLVGLKSLVTRSASPLHSLSLLGVESQMHDIIDLLRATTWLKELNIDDCPVTDEFIDLLAITASIPLHEVADGFLPHLQKLEIRVLWAEFSWNSFASMLAAPSTSEPETNHRRPLSSVSFHMPVNDVDPSRFINEEAILRLTEVTERGFDLTIGYGNKIADLLAESRKFHEDRRREAEGAQE
ncbi:unnamed protein product [Cyclocybe aegerita]|uniref:Uncharacterized protein n=1 Tax=Cyclocybe aegerita TaxID=1973307 RepID=A0A8S0XT27_CYCAE|nr:unnamed protein product [Cyclocybe aegerita]